MASKFMFTDAPERGTVASGLRVLTGLLVTLGLMMALLYSGYMEYTSFEPATDGASPPPARQLEVDSSGRRVTYADAWMAREGRLWQRTLQGSPEQIGAAAGALTGRLYQDIDRQLQKSDDAIAQIQSRREESNEKLRLLEVDVSQQRMKRDHIAGRLDGHGSG